MDTPPQVQGQWSFDMEPLNEVTFIPRKKIARSKKSNTSSALQEEPSKPAIMTVTEVTRRVTHLLEKGIGTVWIEGEVSNYRRQSSGHHYFTLKDAESQIACVLFARTAAFIPQLSLADGMAVQLYGEVTVYQPRGQYQLLVQLVQKKGQGVLQAKFESLKQKLAVEGLFDASRKRPLPRFPRRIGVITSPTAAALADFLKVLHRRHPGLHVVISPVRVQGQGAAQEIAAAIEEFSAAPQALGSVDLIVVTRGGGSLEDLWEFNEEIVARAIAASTLPVVSAVGHEIDYTLSDFAADLRAPTPSAAAELIAADSSALLEKVTWLLNRIARETTGCLHQLCYRQEMVSNTLFFRAPERMLSETRQRIDDLEETLKEHLNRRCQQISFKIEALLTCLRLHHPRHVITQARQRHTTSQQRLSSLLKYQQELLRARIENLRSLLVALSPKATLARGFTITRNEQGAVLTSSKKAIGETRLQTEFVDGTVWSQV